MTARLSTLTLLALLPSCAPWGWSTDSPDPGDAAWVRSAVPAVLGRRAANSSEVLALATIAERHGRQAVLELLYEQPEFAAHWSAVLIDDLMVDRSTANKWREHRRCFTEPLVDDHHDAALVSHLRNARADTCFDRQVEPILRTSLDVDELSRQLQEPPSSRLQNGSEAVGSMLEIAYSPGGAPSQSVELEVVPGTNPEHCTPFRMADVLRAAIRADGLDALYVAYLPVLATQAYRTRFHPVSESGQKFLATYLNRDPACTSCHSGMYSKTNTTKLHPDWDRTWPAEHALTGLMVDLEDAVFSSPVLAHGGYGPEGGAGVVFNTRGFLGYQPGSDFLPYGMDADCVDAGSYTSMPRDGTGGPLLYTALAGRPYGQATVHDVAEQYAAALRSLSTMRLQQSAYFSPPASGTRTANLDPAVHCEQACHSTSRTPDLSVVVPTLRDARLKQIIVEGPGEMGKPYGSLTLSPTDKDEVVAMLRQDYGATVGVPEDRDHALISLLAMRIAGNIWEEVQGAPLTLSHGQPRNEDQATVLQHLSRILVVDWSLRDVLDEILLSSSFRPTAPRDATVDPYHLEPVFEPYSDQPVQASDERNSRGDAVHRRSVHALLRGAAQALEWPVPDPIEEQSGSATSPRWQSAWTHHALGAFLSLGAPGVGRDTDLRWLLEWQALTSTCAPPLVTGPDYVDTLMQATPALTLGEAAVELKDRILNDRTLAEEERPALQALLGASLDTLVDPAQPSHEDALRAYCGALLQTPQFLLAGLDDVDDATQPEAPTPVCTAGPCDTDAWCTYYGDAAARLERPWSCGES